MHMVATDLFREAKILNLQADGKYLPVSHAGPLWYVLDRKVNGLRASVCTFEEPKISCFYWESNPDITSDIFRFTEL